MDSLGSKKILLIFIRTKDIINVIVIFDSVRVGFGVTISVDVNVSIRIGVGAKRMKHQSNIVESDLVRWTMLHCVKQGGQTNATFFNNIALNLYPPRILGKLPRRIGLPKKWRESDRPPSETDYRIAFPGLTPQFALCLFFRREIACILVFIFF